MTIHHRRCDLFRTRKNKILLIGSGIALFVLLACNAAALPSMLFATPTPTVTLTPTPTATPIPTATPRPTATLPPPPTAIPVTKIESAIIPLLNDNGFVYEPDFKCPVDNNGRPVVCNEYNSNIQMTVILYPGGWIEFDVWPTDALGPTQGKILDKFVISSFGEPMDKHLADLLEQVKNQPNTLLESSFDTRYTSIQLDTTYGEVLIVIGPPGSATAPSSSSNSSG